jgi:hypothetical protein
LDIDVPKGWIWLALIVGPWVLIYGLVKLAMWVVEHLMSIVVGA